MRRCARTGTGGDVDGNAGDEGKHTHTQEEGEVRVRKRRKNGQALHSPQQRRDLTVVHGEIQSLHRRLFPVMLRQASNDHVVRLRS